MVIFVSQATESTSFILQSWVWLLFMRAGGQGGGDVKSVGAVVGGSENVSVSVAIRSSWMFKVCQKMACCSAVLAVESVQFGCGWVRLSWCKR